MLDEVKLGLGGEVAQGTVVVLLVGGHGGLGRLQVAEELGVGLVPRVGHVQLELVDAVGVVVAGVALHLNGVRHVHILKAPLILGASLPDVVDELKALQMLVRLAVQLEVGLEVGLVGAQVAQVGAVHDGDAVVVGRLGAVELHVLV